jgi:alkylated DNA repair dioxygenase AlkB
MTGATPYAYAPGRGRAWRPEGRPAAAPVSAFQGSLLDVANEPELGALGAAVERRPLAHGAWVDVRRGWVRGSDMLFERLRDGAQWQAERRQMYDRVVDVPRLNCYLGADDAWPDPFLRELQAALNAHYADADPFVTCGMAYYRDGRDSVAWHGDTFGRGSTDDVLVAIVSTGALRTFQLRPRGGGPAIRYDIGHGDLLVMGGSCQRTWEHAVPKSARASGPRISVQFRPREVR